MKVLTNEQMRAVDARAQAEYGVQEQSLMEEAGRAVAMIARQRFEPRFVLVVCGKGNNAGDGYVVARYLKQAGTNVKVVAVGEPSSLKGAAELAFREATQTGVSIVTAAELDDNLSRADLVVDALCGTGIRGPLRGVFAGAVQAISAAPVSVLAVDVPSGVRELSSQEELGPVVQADLTVAIGAPKLCSVTLPGSLYTGELIVERINFPPQLLDSDEWCYNLAPLDELKGWLPPRPLTANKGTFGKVGIVAGSAPFAGAALLASRAALRSGAGLVYLFTTESLNPIAKTVLPEAVSVIVPSRLPGWLDDSSFAVIAETASRLDVLAVGMGLGTGAGQQELVRTLVSELSLPMVLDADALTVLAACGMPKLRENVVLTPHPGEMARLLKCPVQEILQDRFAAATMAAAQTNAAVLLKGPDTLIARPDGQVWINAGACSALAKGGTGDVLSGVIASLMGQGLEAWRAAVLGARLHLEAGRLCADLVGECGVLASEVADMVPRVLARWRRA